MIGAPLITPATWDAVLAGFRHEAQQDAARVFGLDLRPVPPWPPVNITIEIDLAPMTAQLERAAAAIAALGAQMFRTGPALAALTTALGTLEAAGWASLTPAQRRRSAKRLIRETIAERRMARRLGR